MSPYPSTVPQMELLERISGAHPANTTHLKKVKDLRKAVSGKVDKAPEYLKIKKEHGDVLKRMQASANLWHDVRRGVPEAVQYVEKYFGFIPVLPGQQKPEGDNSQQKDTGKDTDNQAGRIKLDKSKFIDDARDNAVCI